MPTFATKMTISNVLPTYSCHQTSKSVCPAQHETGQESFCETGSKGLMERAAGTFQHRLITELRLAGATTMEQAKAVLQQFLPRFNRRSQVPAQCRDPAFRPLPPDLHLVATALNARGWRYLRTNPTPEIRFDRDQPPGIAWVIPRYADQLRWPAVPARSLSPTASTMAAATAVAVAGSSRRPQPSESGAPGTGAGLPAPAGPWS